ncbi:MAG: protein kinase domain-containing protein [Steroidobacteraceae bacterium]
MLNDQSHIQTQPLRVHRIPGEPRDKFIVEPVKRKDATNESAPFDRLVDERYRLSARLGRGRLGIVYEAQDELNRNSGIERRVAVQLLDEDLVAGPGFAEEFTRGAATLHAISHPNIVRLLEHGHDGSRYFLVLELLESASLRFVLNDVAQLPLDEAAPVIRAVGDALQYLHAKRIVHGNLKPENALVTFGYEVKLLDIVPPEWPAAAQGDIDDVDYMAPPRPDSRDDVYGLACLAYEMLSGRHPFNANSPEEAYRAELELAPIARLPARQWRALVGALELQREHRTPTVAQFLDEFGVTGIEKLRTVVSGAPEPSRTPAPAPIAPAPAPPPPRMSAATLTAERAMGYGEPRRSGIAGMLMLLILLVGIGAVAFIYQDQVRDQATGLMADIDARLNERAAAPAAEPAAEEPVVAAAPVEDAPIVDATPGAAPAPADEAATSAGPPAAAAANAPVPALAAASPESPPAGAEAAPVGVETTEPAPAEASSGPARFSFLQPVATVRESEVAARIVIRRTGNASGRAAIAWWTDEGSAIAERDYADLGRRVEEFAPGERQRTVFVPLANDTEQEPTKSFNVYLGSGYAGSGSEPLSGMRIDVVDDD